MVTSRASSWAGLIRRGSARFVSRRATECGGLILHEEVEKLGLHYLHAHQLATRAEQAAVRAAGIDWRDYDRFMQKYVKEIGDGRLTKVPADLDEKPYRDEHDTDLLQRMNAAIEKKQVPKEIGKPRVQQAADRLEDHIERRRTTHDSDRRHGVGSGGG
jgi:hypothetical protein